MSTTLKSAEPSFFAKHIKGIILFLLLALTGLGIAIGSMFYEIQYEPRDGGSYSEALVGEPEKINPLFSRAKDADQDITSLVFSGLMKYDVNQELVPDLAESYTVSEDGKNFTFTLKDGVKWHDGEPLTADDVVFTVQTMKNSDVGSTWLGSFSSVAVEKIDEKTVKFTLTNDGYSPFLLENSTFGVLPQHVWEEVLPTSIGLSDLNLQPVGSGPYKFKEYKKDKKTGSIISYTLIRNDDYFGEKPYIQHLMFEFFMDWDTALEVYQKGDVDGVSFIEPESKEFITDKTKDSSQIMELGFPQYYALFFNWEQNPALEQRNVRRAIAHSINYERIITEALDGTGYPVYSAILPNFLGHNEDVQKYPYSFEEARKELEKGSWEYRESENAWYKNDQKLEFSIFVNDREPYFTVAEIISDELSKVGISAIVEPFDATTLQTEIVKPRGYDTLLYGQLVLHDPDPYPFWHSGARKDPGLNLSSFKNSTVDDLLETARKTNDENARVEKYTHFQNELAEELPAIFLYSPTYTYAVSNSVQGISLDYITLPSDRFAGIHTWYVKKKPVLVSK